MVPLLFKQTLGCYIPSFYRMELNFPFPSESDRFKPLNEKFLSAFIHEYVHFLQDITTYFGYNNAYVYSEQVHGLVNSLYKYPPGQILLPHKIPGNYANIELNKFINSHGWGTYNKEVDNLIITRYKKQKIKVPIVGSPIKELCKIKVEYMGGKSAIEFGSMAIMESMAYMIESMTTKGCSTPHDYPYCAAQLICEHIYPEFADDKLRVIALCDMSLHFSEPGRVFVDSLEKFRSESFLPSNANEIIDYFYNNTCIQIDGPIKLLDGIIMHGINAGERLKSYLNHLNFSQFHNVIHTLFGYGIGLRIHHRYFMLDIARNGYALNNTPLKDAIFKAGTPIIFDSNNEHWMVYPRKLTQHNYQIEYFLAIGQVFNTIAKGNDACDLYPWCEKSKGVTVDERCIMYPWKRSKDIFLCPYAMLWRHWDLSKYNPQISYYED